MGRQTNMTTWYGEVLARVGTAGGHHFLHYPPPPQYHALGALCRVYELPRDACSREHTHHAKLMSFVPRLWEWSLLLVDLDRLQVSA